MYSLIKSIKKIRKAKKKWLHAEVAIMKANIGRVTLKDTGIGIVCLQSFVVLGKDFKVK